MAPFISSLGDHTTAHIDANNHGYSGTVTHHDGNISINGNVHGDWHGHNQYGGNIEYHPNDHVTFGTDVTVDPSGHQASIGGHVEWNF